MKKISILLLIIFTTFSSVSAQDRNINFTNLADCLQEFQTAVGGYYGTRVLRISQGMTMPTIEKYMASWKANRCVLRGIMMANEEDLGYNPDMNQYTLVISLPKGKAYLSFRQNNKGFYRFIKYETEGNINSCPQGNTPTNNFYANVDVIGEWYFKDIAWNTQPKSLKDYLSSNGYDENKIKNTLSERVKSLTNPALATYGVVVFNADGTGKYVTTNGDKAFQWRLQYNQLQLNDGTGWSATSWRIDKDGNLNLIDYQGDEKGNVGFIYGRK
jgi:hypothetical protein